MKATTSHGFTLYELLVSLLVAGIIFGVGLPNFLEFQRSNAMAAAANELVGGLYAARAEAVKRQVPVTVCGSAAPLVAAPVCSAGGNGGFIVFVDENGDGDLTDPTDGNAAVDAGETVLLQRPAPGGTMNVTTNNGDYVAYGPNGFAVNAAPGHPQPGTTSILLCDERGNVDLGGRSAARAVTIAPTGRAHALQTTADVAAAVAATGGACP